ncbi:nuclear transport factor, putative [Entamoeba invadens IP1]|uniref:nuclear transport factor, putative n=1 Tax=Entamoeba invadens IP1 TaxID=370355 RepID=UPI0002C3DB34|nr:nuclear transport factor, putative [Entamoeba invadens IP1]ELP93124.1 nuclear transport factor, putative [Entamoeba invadens IP1]|eukprot:XP_004259895.1 nuclear transport factor, putative [Entamoeba invadens IP1]
MSQQDQLKQFAAQFVSVFYNSFDTNKANLANFFQPMSTLTFETNTIQGAQNILQHIQNLPFKQTQHQIAVLDVQQVPGSVPMLFIKVIGRLTIDGENPLLFTESFILTQANNNWFVLNDIMRLANI